MRLAFFVNEVDTELDEFATTRLARAAARAGHETWYVGAGDVELGDGDRLTARARRVEFQPDDTLSTLLDRVKERDAERIVLDDVDALFLRNESVTDLQERPWASSMGFVLGQMLAQRGVTVVNDPTTLQRASSKLYLEEFPEKVRPRSLVTRDAEAVARFVGDVGHCVLKPLYGGKGHSVFIVEDGEPNLAQMTDTVLEDGYAVVQEYVDGAAEGDARIFLLEGRLIEVDGQPAAFRRVPQGTDQRSNISVGAKMAPLEIGSREQAIAEAMGDKLAADGMFFVGIDLVGDKVLEINADSPGGIQAVEWLYDVDICPAVIEALERRHAAA